MREIPTAAVRLTGDGAQYVTGLGSGKSAYSYNNIVDHNNQVTAAADDYSSCSYEYASQLQQSLWLIPTAAVG